MWLCMQFVLQLYFDCLSDFDGFIGIYSGLTGPKIIFFSLCPQKHKSTSASLKYRYSHSVTGSLKILVNDHGQDTSNRYLLARILFS